MNPQPNTCLDCGKEITKGAARCRKCSTAFRYPKHNYCEICGTELARKRESYPSTLCLQCYRKSVSKPPNHCRLCGKEISRHSKTGLCRPCLDAERIKNRKHDYCLDCGKEISSDTKTGRCSDCVSKYIWSNRRAEMVQKQKQGWDKPGVKESFGEMVAERWQDEKWASDTISKIRAGWSKDGSPFQSNLEQSIQNELDSLGINYKTQWQIIGHRYLYDIFIPKAMLLVEVNGEFWHYSDYAKEQGFVERDAEKKQVAEQNGYNVVYLRESIINELGPEKAVSQHIVPRL